MGHLCMAFIVAVVAAAILHRFGFLVQADGFVEEVSCSSDRITVILNKTDPDIQRWMANQNSVPIVYVYGFKNRTPCGVALKFAPPNGAARVFFNFSIPYGPSCNVFLVDVEPHFLSAETTIAIEDNAVQDLSKPLRINHIFCLYTSEVQALKINDVSNGHQVIASTGGKPKPKVQMLFRNNDGTPLKAAKFGDQVSLYLMLNPDNAYKAIMPKHCMFSDRDDMKETGAKTLTFVQSNCPVTELGEIIQPLQDINEEIYYTQFQAFRFGQQSTVYAHCTVEVCLDAERCEKHCYRRVFNSSNGLVENEHRRTRRNSGSITIPAGPDVSRRRPGREEIAISNQLVVLDEYPADTDYGPAAASSGGGLRSVDSRSTCGVVALSQSPVLLSVIGALSGLLFASCVALVCMWLKLRSRSVKELAIVASSTLQRPPSACYSERTGRRSGASSTDWTTLERDTHCIPRIQSTLPRQ